MVALASSCVYAKRFTDAEKKLNAIKSHNLSVEKWKKLYSLKPAAEQKVKPKEQPLATVTKMEDNVSSGVKQQALKPSPPKAQFQQQPQQQPQPNNTPVITKNPKEEKQKKERYVMVFRLLFL